MAGATRLELATSGVTGRRSNQTELHPRKSKSIPSKKESRLDGAAKPRFNYNRETILIWWAEQGLNL